MASSRKTGTNENISTYDSAGGKDYSALATWEGDTDNDLVTLAQSEVLECYAGNHSDTLGVVLGATTNSSYFRIIRPASGEGHSGIPKTDGSCVAFSVTANVWIHARENNFQAQDLVITHTINTTSNKATLYMGAGDKIGFIGILLFDGSNTGSASLYGTWQVSSSGTAYYVNCLVHNYDGYGFYDDEGTNYYYNCSATDNGTGFREYNNINPTAKNCASSGNSTDWSGTWTKTTCTDEGAAPTYVDSANDDFHLDSSDTVCIDSGTDLSSDATYAFDDDIDGDTRSVTWDIGFDEYVVVASSSGSGGKFRLGLAPKTS